MTEETGGAPQGKSRWLKVALIASLALNLLFVGGVAKAVWHHKHGGGRDGDAGLMGFVNRLPAERQSVLRGDIEAARLTIRPLREAARAAWADSNAALVAEPFDKDKYKAAADRLNDTEAKFKAAVAASLADAAAKLTPEERQRLQKWREKRRPHIFGRNHGRRDGHGSDGKKRDDD